MVKKILNKIDKIIYDRLLKRRRFNIKTGEINTSGLMKDYWFPSPGINKEIERKKSINKIFRIQSF